MGELQNGSGYITGEKMKRDGNDVKTTPQVKRFQGELA
jgi:hypothetical protein